VGRYHHLSKVLQFATMPETGRSAQSSSGSETGIYLIVHRLANHPLLTWAQADRWNGVHAWVCYVLDLQGWHTLMSLLLFVQTVTTTP
jgi:hypothetical protein